MTVTPLDGKLHVDRAVQYGMDYLRKNDWKPHAKPAKPSVVFHSEMRHATAILVWVDPNAPLMGLPYFVVGLQPNGKYFTSRWAHEVSEIVNPPEDFVIHPAPPTPRALILKRRLVL